MNVTSSRSGTVVRTLTGYSAFLPKTLPPDPPIHMDAEMQSLLSIADRKLGRLDGIIQVLPNPDLFLAMYVKKEAILSSQIEGTQASLVDVLNTPDKGKSEPRKDGVEDVVNYVHAMNWGLDRLEHLPLSLRLIREIHEILLKGVRGFDKNPGEFRKTQNWIGTPGCTLATATFVPPPADEMLNAMGDLESFFYKDDFIPALIKIAMIHAQFETIHPFLDGNGRVGRLLITFWLCQQEILSKPLLYLSYYFKQNRSEYYERLMNVRLHGDWENWIKFFLKGIAFVSDEATNSAKAIISLKDSYAQKLYSIEGTNNHCQKLLDYIFEKPIVNRKEVAEYLDISSPTAGTLIDLFCKTGILTDVTPDKLRYKEYYFQEYLDILEKGTEL
ncbi:MAG: Fic family protein [Clostridiales bacterium]|nr:Fic family protein [Clostridiales bacterium]